MKPRERTAVAIAAVVVGVFVLQYFVWAPTAARHRVLDGRIAKKSAQVRRLKGLWEARADIEAAFKRWAPGRGAPAMVGNAGLKDLERLARGAGVSIRDLRPGAGNPARILEMTLEGSYASLATFVDALETGPADLFVDKMTLDRGAGAGRPLRARLTIRFAGAPSH